MNILFVSRAIPYTGGREIIVESLLNHFSKKGKVILLSPDRHPKKKNLQVIDSNKPLKEIVEKLANEKIDIMSCHTFYLFPFANKLAKKLKIPVILTLHNVLTDYYDQSYRRKLEFLLKNADGVTIVSDRLREKMLREFDSDKEIITIQNGIQLTKKNEALPDLKIVVIPARLNPIKGLDAVIEVANEFEDDVQFHICSPNGRKNENEREYRKNLMQKIKKYGLQRKVKLFTLSHSQFLKKLNHTTVCFLPSLIEGVSISLLEAMSRGIIVVSTNVGGTVEIIRDGKTGFLISPNNLNQMKKTLKNVISLPENKRKRISKAARNLIRDEFNEKGMTKKYENYFKRILRN